MEEQILFIDKLKNWKVSTDNALERFAGDVELYRKCLQEFTKDKSFESLYENISCRKYSEAFEDAHSLKGVSANLSLSPIYDVICLIVEKLRKCNFNGLDADVAKLKEIKSEYDELIYCG